MSIRYSSTAMIPNKYTTGIVGIEALPNAREALATAVRKVLAQVKMQIPEGTGYRKIVRLHMSAGSISSRKQQACAISKQLSEADRWKSYLRRLRMSSASSRKWPLGNLGNLSIELKSWGLEARIVKSFGLTLQFKATGKSMSTDI